MEYAEAIGSPEFPVFADGTGALMGATPMTQRVHPELCGLTPSLEIMDCYSGHKAYLSALQDIRVHAGL